MSERGGERGGVCGSEREKSVGVGIGIGLIIIMSWNCVGWLLSSLDGKHGLASRNDKCQQQEGMFIHDTCNL